MLDTKYLVVACSPEHRMYAYPNNRQPSYFSDGDDAHEAARSINDAEPTHEVQIIMLKKSYPLDYDMQAYLELNRNNFSLNRT